MNNTKDKLGRLIYFLTYPLLVVYLRGTIRPRVVLQHKRQVLLVRPTLGRGEWDFPGGGVHQNETIKQAAIREAHEELGISLHSSKLKKIDAYEIKHGLVQFDVVIFRSLLDKKPVLKIHPIEIAEARWVGSTTLRHLELAQGVEKTALRCLKS